MQISVLRDISTGVSTTGIMSVNTVFECYTLEDVVRTGPKVMHETAIPAGTYRVNVTYSNRFKKDLPLLANVPGFEGIRIHPGNTKEDTSGCILVGCLRSSDRVGQSVLAFNKLFEKIQTAIKAGEEVYITVS